MVGCRYVWEDSMWIKNRNGEPLILLFGRNVDNPYLTTTTVVKGVEPYFYAPAESVMFPREVIRVDKVCIDAFGRKVKKCITRLPSDVPVAKKAFEWTDEADVLFDKRFVVDRGIVYGYKVEETGSISSCEVENPILPRICYYDIEVRSPQEIIPQPATAEWPIVSIQCMDSYTKEVVVFTWGVPIVKDCQVDCGDERGLLDKWMLYIQERDFDVITGWYSNRFDMPYIIRRAERIEVPLNRLTRLPNGFNRPRAEERGNREWSLRVSGRQIVDMWEAFKKWYKAEGELENYDLKSVSKRFAGFEYVDYGAKIDELFREERWEEFVQYCWNDAVALGRIDEKIKLFEFYESLRYKVGVKLEETLMNSRMIESLLMRSGIKPMPSRVYGTVSAGYSGALVLTPKVGLHDNVGVFDLAALYPTIIIGFNVSPDVDKMIPKVIKTMIDEREKLRALKMAGKADESTKKKETVLKFIVNSFYGVLGWPGFRLYKPEMAEFITTTGREINVALQNWSKEKGFTPIYGDTDSIFIAGVDSVSVGRELQSYYNEKLSAWASEKGSVIDPTIKFEKQYRRILFKKKSTSDGEAKKRYAGHIVWKDGFEVDKLDYTGIELKRSDQSKFTKDVLEEFLKDLLLKDNPQDAIQVIRDAIRRVKNGEVSIFDVSVPKGVKDLDSDNPWCRGVRNTERILGRPFPVGFKPRVVYTKGDIREVCIAEDISEEEIREKVVVDWTTIQNKVVEKKLKSFVESIGMDWADVIHGQKGFDEWI